MSRNKTFILMVIVFILMIVINLTIAFNGNLNYLEYFGYVIEITPFFRLKCLLGSGIMGFIVLAMVVLTIIDEIKTKKAKKEEKKNEL